MVDAYVARCMHRRLNYNPENFLEWERRITEILLERSLGFPHEVLETPHFIMENWNETRLVDVNVLRNFAPEVLPTDMLKRLLKVLHRSLAHVSFELITVHDDYKCHPNHMNRTREEYKEILVEIAESNLMQDLLAQLGRPGYQKLSTSLGRLVEKSSYALT